MHGAKIKQKLFGLDYKRQPATGRNLTAKRDAPQPGLVKHNPGVYRDDARPVREIPGLVFSQQNRENNIAAGRAALERELKRLGREDMSYEEVSLLFSFPRAEDFLAAIGHGDINSGQIASHILEAERRTGKERLDRELRKLGREDMSVDAVAGLFGYKQGDEFLAAIGYGDIPPDQVRERILAHEQQQAVEAQRRDTPFDASDGIEIVGSGSGLLVNLARCCHPTPGDDIVGYITRGRGITVHRSDCSNVINVREPDRLINVNWKRAEDTKTYPVPVMIVAYDREGLMRDIGGVIADEKINMSTVSITTKQNIATFLVTMEIADVSQLTRVLTKIERLPNVVEAHRRTAV